MANTKMDVIESALDETIQTRASQSSDGLVGARILQLLVPGEGIIPPWWSTARDAMLRKYWQRSDHLSGAVYTLQAKMTAIPFQVVPIDRSNRQFVKQSQDYLDRLKWAAEFGEGWATFFGKFVLDLLTQDNGAFAEIIGPGPKDGPLTAAPITVAHLDSAACTRTGNAEYPVIFRDLEGKMYKLHFTRVMYTSQMPSTAQEMFGVGLCAVSRCANIAQNLMDIVRFKQEKLGSRPHSGIMITQGGLDPEDVDTAFMAAEAELSSLNLTRYGKIVVVGHRSLQEADMKLIELASLPDGFNEETSTIMGMAAIALAFGVDARELFPAMTAGATRADALLAHLKQRGKGPGQILEAVEALFDQKILPAHLKLRFDFQDDAEDRQAAEIRRVRSQRRYDDIIQQITTPGIERQLMLEEGEISRSQFRKMELSDGRLENGDPVLSLFWNDDPVYQELLSPVINAGKNILDVESNNAAQILKKVAVQKAETFAKLMQVKTDEKRWVLHQILAALEAVEALYEPIRQIELEMEAAEELAAQETPGSANGAVKRTPDKRLRTQDQRSPNGGQATNASDTLRGQPEDNQPKEVRFWED